MNSMIGPKPIAAFAIWLALVAVAPAQGAQASTPAGSTSGTEKAVKLPPFTVESTAGGGWRETNTISATRVNMALVKISQPVSVLSAEFIKDIDAFDLDEAVKYVSSVSTSQFAGGIYNVRGWRVGESLRNGVPFLTQIAPVTINVKRVEFLKGPGGKRPSPTDGRRSRQPANVHANL